MDQHKMSLSEMMRKELEKQESFINKPSVLMPGYTWTPRGWVKNPSPKRDLEVAVTKRNDAPRKTAAAVTIAAAAIGAYLFVKAQ